MRKALYAQVRVAFKTKHCHPERGAPACVRPGVVASTKGPWPRDSKQGAAVNATVDERDSDMGGGAVYHDNRVRVEKVG